MIHALYGQTKLTKWRWGKDGESDFDMRLVQLTLMGLLYQNIVLLRHYSHLLLQWRSILAIKYVV